MLKKSNIDNISVKNMSRKLNDKEEIIHQIPHFIFPIVGLFITTIPRTLVLLFNHPNVLNKVINEIKN